jgi:CheY-like chemotaxis protein/HPt (histidine-containing phosphotransfer) domain-containing protein
MIDFRRLLQRFRPKDGAARTLADDRRLVLVVDDQRTNRTLLVRLINMLGYVAEATDSGAAALEKWHSGRFALMITDCHMAEMDGYALARSIRETEAKTRAPRMPIIAWTAVGEAGPDQQSAHEAGMDGHLPKPVELEALASLLHRWLPSGDGQANSAASCGATTVPGSPHVVLDRAVLARYSSGDVEQEREILRDFRSAYIADVAQLERGIAQHDPLLVAHAAHRLKGASRMIGAMAFASICERIEVGGRANDWGAISAAQEGYLRDLGELNDVLDSC